MKTDIFAQTLSRTIYVDLSDNMKETDCNIYYFYYIPGIEREDYPWEGRNNFMGIKDKRNSFSKFSLFSDLKLLFRAIGYEPYDVDTDTIPNSDTLKINMKPKIYSDTVTLTEKNGKIIPVLSAEQPLYTTFFGECKPVYYSDGSHGDPPCAFSCLATCYPAFIEGQIKEALSTIENDLPAIRKTLKNGKECSFLFSFLYRKITGIEEEQTQDIIFAPLKQVVQTTEWSIDNNNGTTYQIRLVFK